MTCLWLGLCGLLALSAPAFAGEESPSHVSQPSVETAPPQPASHSSCLPEHGKGGDRERDAAGQASASTPFEYIQIETSDITRHELFFEKILQAERQETIDHPQKDAIRGYCYRQVHVVIRQDVQHPRPTGWVQLKAVRLEVYGPEGFLIGFDQYVAAQ